MDNDFLIIHGEDDAVDVRIMQEVLSSMDYNGGYKNIALGPELLDYIFFRGTYSNGKHRLPDLIILDIGLPGCDGKDVLSAVRADNTTQAIPVIMSSGSSSLRDYHQCISLGSNAYIQKSSNLDNFTHVCRLFIEGWQKLNQQDFF